MLYHGTKEHVVSSKNVSKIVNLMVCEKNNTVKKIQPSLKKKKTQDSFKAKFYIYMYI